MELPRVQQCVLYLYSQWCSPKGYTYAVRCVSSTWFILYINTKNICKYYSDNFQPIVDILHFLCHKCMEKLLSCATDTSKKLKIPTTGILGLGSDLGIFVKLFISLEDPKYSTNEGQIAFERAHSNWFDWLD